MLQYHMYTRHVLGPVTRKYSQNADALVCLIDACLSSRFIGSNQREVLTPSK